MSVNKIVLDSLEVDEFHLCALYSSLPSYKMAFLLNKHLSLRLRRYEKDVEVLSEKGIEIFPCYIFEDENNYTVYSLFKNKCFFQNVIKREKADLFANEPKQKSVRNLIAEYKEVDYFLKIETDNFKYNTELLVSKISLIDQVITSFEVDCDNIKFKTNLIIE